MVYLSQYYHPKRGRQAKTLIREAQQQRKIIGSHSAYPKDLKAIWQGKSLQNPLYDNQNHESGVCSCKCTPSPKDTFKHKRRDRPYAQIQGERKPEKEAV